jgi:hypothetical protein
LATCAPVLTQPSAAWINEFLREHCTGMDDHDDPHEECAKCQHMRMQLNYQLGAERPVLPVTPIKWIGMKDGHFDCEVDPLKLDLAESMGFEVFALVPAAAKEK